MRLFTAIELPDELRGAIAEVLEDLARSVNGVKWVEPWNLHITLKFLGEVEPDNVPGIIDSLQKVSHQCRRFVLYPDKTGFFPERGAPRVIWLGLKGDLEGYYQLGQMIDEVLAPTGWEPEQRRKAHITLGRIKRTDRNNQMLINLSKIPDYSRMAIKVDHFTLFESILTREGPVYKPLEKFGFNS